MILQKNASLIEALQAFMPVADENGMGQQFAELAKYFLYGGYIHVKSSRVDRKIYIREVEFYFYDETHEIPSNKIVYHRNGNYKNVPDNAGIPIGQKTHYFKPGELYLHASGVDITFESEEKQYRASALIRAFSVEENGHLQSIYIDKGKDRNVDPRSTYVYEYLFEGLSIFSPSDFSIKWVDDWIPDPPLLQGLDRIRVTDKETGLKDEKKWRFKRPDV